MDFLIGSNGLLGTALKKKLKPMVLDRSVYREWHKKECKRKVLDFFKGQGLKKDSVVYIASGIIDSNKEELLRQVNYELPKNIIQALREEEIKVITFGSILETLLPDHSAYSKSKVLLSNFLKNMKSSKINCIHVRLHTLYGGNKIHDQMFLGQIQYAIKHNQEFKMTAGKQLREYHHLDDVIYCIKWIIENSHSGIINLNNGKPIQLVELAKSIFASFKKSELLSINKNNLASSEIYEEQIPHKAYYDLPDRDHIDQITQHIRRNLSLKT